jgi:pimeloyl-ACP methyl ester carboxylesterase
MNKFTSELSLLLLPILFSVFSVSAQVTTPAKTPAAGQTAFVQEPAKLETATGTLYGTLMLPPSKGPNPVVLIIAGSGPTDRNGNSTLLNGPNDSLKMLAQGLAENGIASLRYDKRGIAESAKAMKGEADLRFDDYVNDAMQWGEQLRKDKRFSTLTIAGHSEGSLIGMIAAQKAGADGYISIAGLARPANLIILDQVRPKLPPDLLKTTEDILALLVAGKTVDNVPPSLAPLFRPSVQPYMISWFRYDPSKEIAKLTVPVLIAQGTTDIQVTVDEAKALAKAKPSAKLVLIDGMNHVMKQVPVDQDKQGRSYSDPSLPVEPRLITEMASFVKNVKGK